MSHEDLKLNVLPKGSSCIKDKKVPSPSPYFNSDEVTRCDSYDTSGKSGKKRKKKKKKKRKPSYRDEDGNFTDKRMKNAFYWAAQTRGWFVKGPNALSGDTYCVEVRAGQAVIVLDKSEKGWSEADVKTIRDSLHDHEWPTIKPKNVRELDDEWRIFIPPSDKRLKSNYVNNWKHIDPECTSELPDEKKGKKDKKKDPRDDPDPLKPPSNVMGWKTVETERDDIRWQTEYHKGYKKHILPLDELDVCEVQVLSHGGRFKHRWTARRNYYNTDGKIAHQDTITQVHTSKNPTKNRNRAVRKAIDWMEEHPKAPRPKPEPDDEEDEDDEPAPEYPRFMIEGEGSLLKNNLKVLNRIAKHGRGSAPAARLEVHKERLKIQGVDAANVLMATMNIEDRDAGKLVAKKTGVGGFDIVSLWKKVKQAKMGDDLSVYVTGPKDDPELAVEVNGSSVGSVTLLPEKDVREITVPDLPEDATVRVTGKRFKKVVRGATIVQDKDEPVWLIAEDGKSGIFVPDRPSGFRGDFQAERVKGEAKARYSLGYLRTVSMVPRPASTKVVLKWADDMPLSATYRINKGTVRLLLAPRIASKKEGDDEYKRRKQEATLNEHETLPFPELKDLVMHCETAAPDGTVAPTIEATAHNGETVKADLGDMAEAVVFFYPNTAGCRCSVQAMQFQELQDNRGTPVYGIAAQEPHEIKTFAEQYDIEYPLLSDPDGELAEKFGVPVENGKAGRATFFIKNGYIVDEVRDGMAEPGEKLAEETETITLHQTPEILEHFEHPSVGVIVGERGAGKSSTAYHVADELYKKDGVQPVVVGMPESKQEHLPDHWTTVETMDEAPADSVLVVDEAYRKFHSRNTQSSEAVDMSTLVNLSRHCNRSILFVTQETRQLDPNAVGQADAVFMKRPAPLQIEFERPQMRNLMETAKKSFDQLPSDQKHQAYTYVVTRQGKEFVPTSEADFYGDELSKSYEGACTVQRDEDGEVKEVGLSSAISFAPSCER